MTNMFDEIKNMYDNELYENVVCLASFALSIVENNPADTISPGKFQTYVYYGHALYHLGKYRKAESMYNKALEFRKEYFKHVGSNKSQSNLKEFMPDNDIKYQIHKCLLHRKQVRDAMNILEGIPVKQRTTKIQMAMGKLFQQVGLERPATCAYKEVLRECPLSLEAIEGLISLGVTGAEVQSIVLECTTRKGIGNIDWLMTWIKCHDQIYSRQYTQAIATLKSLDKQSAIRNNITLVVTLGEAFYFNGDAKNSLSTFHRAHLMDPLMERGIDMYASLLAKEKKIVELENLFPANLTTDEYSSEMWAAVAYYMYVSKKATKAAYLAQKSLLLNSHNIEALLLKGAILFEMKKYQEAIDHFRQAIHLSPYRFEAHRGLVNVYVAMHRLREALATASGVCKQLGNTARTLTLYGSVLMKEAVSICKAKNLLEKALILDETYLPAVYSLVSIYDHELNTDGMINLLEKQTKIQPSCRLHQMLGDAYARCRKEQKALEHYIIALQIEPGNRRALEGMNRIDQSCNKLDSNYYMTVNEEDNLNNTCEMMESSEYENEAGEDSSEFDFAWSDLDIGLNNI